MLKKLRYFSVVQRNGYFARQEYALIAMLGDGSENVRNVGVAKVLAHRKQVAVTKVQMTMTAHCSELQFNFTCSMYQF